MWDVEFYMGTDVCIEGPDQVRAALSGLGPGKKIFTRNHHFALMLECWDPFLEL